MRKKKIDRHIGLSEHAANHAYQLNPGKSNTLKDCINYIEGSYIPDIEQSQVFSINDDFKTVPLGQTSADMLQRRSTGLESKQQIVILAMILFDEYKSGNTVIDQRLMP